MTRQTQQRDAISKVIETSPRPLSPQEICEEAQQRQPRLGIATVYRNIKALLEEGKIVSVVIPGQAPRYEQAGLGHHHHFFCSTCEKVYELQPGCPGNLNQLAPDGFEVTGHSIVLEGNCKDCNVMTLNKF